MQHATCCLSCGTTGQTVMGHVSRSSSNASSWQDHEAEVESKSVLSCIVGDRWITVSKRKLCSNMFCISHLGISHWWVLFFFSLIRHIMWEFRGQPHCKTWYFYLILLSYFSEYLNIPKSICISVRSTLSVSFSENSVTTEFD